MAELPALEVMVQPHVTKLEGPRDGWARLAIRLVFSPIEISVDDSSRSDQMKCNVVTHSTGRKHLPALYICGTLSIVFNFPRLLTRVEERIPDVYLEGLNCGLSEKKPHLGRPFNVTLALCFTIAKAHLALR